MATKDSENVRRAKSRRDQWDPRSSKCPICGRPFRDDESCPHGVRQAYDNLDAKVRKAYAAQDTKTLDERVARLEGLVQELAAVIVILRRRSARY